MTLRTALLASVFGTAFILMAGHASAVPISGTSSGVFSGLSGCDSDNSGGGNNPRNCDLQDTAQGSNTQIRWGTTSNSSSEQHEFENPSLLTAIDTTISLNPASFADDVLLAQLQWFNSSTQTGSSPQGPATFAFNYALTITFTQPNGASDTETFNLSVGNTVNPTGDAITGFTAADLANLAWSLGLVTVSDLHWISSDEGGNSGASGCTTAGVGTNGDAGFTAPTWFNCELNTASLFLVGDFTVGQAVPEPGTLALLGFGLIGVGAIRRRKAA
jgi:hypothetical protein